MVVAIKKIEVAIGLWGTTCFTLAGMIDAHYATSRAALFACALASGLYFAFLVWTHKPNTRLELLPAITAASINAFCLGLLTFGFGDLLQPQVSRFGLTQTTSFMSLLDKEHATPFRFLWDRPGLVTVPIQLMMGLIIENEQAKPTTIVAYGLSWAHAANGPWQPLCPVSSLGARLYWTSDPSQSIETGADDFADRKLIGQRLLPFEPVQFKTAWECTSECSSEYLKFSVSEANGQESATILRARKGTMEKIGVGESMQIFGPDHRMDLSQATISFAPNCKP